MSILLVVFWHVVTKSVQQIDWGDAGQIPGLWATLNAQLLPLRMPLFFLVSGLFAWRAVFAPERSTLTSRVARLLSLYALWLLIQTFALAAAPDFDTARAHDLGEFFAQLTFSPTNLWFLLALAVFLVVGRITARVPTSVVLIAALLLSAVAATGVIPDLGNLWQIP